jgi:hypothetical protein
MAMRETTLRWLKGQGDDGELLATSRWSRRACRRGKPSRDEGRSVTKALGTVAETFDGDDGVRPLRRRWACLVHRG